MHTSKQFAQATPRTFTLSPIISRSCAFQTYLDTSELLVRAFLSKLFNNYFENSIVLRPTRMKLAGHISQISGLEDVEELHYLTDNR